MQQSTPEQQISEPSASASATLNEGAQQQQAPEAKESESNAAPAESQQPPQKPSMFNRLLSWLYTQAVNTPPSSMFFWISVAAASWFFSNFINKKRYQYKVFNLREQQQQSLTMYRQEYRRKEDHLQRTLARLQEEVDISKQAIQHNAMLRQKQTLLNEQLVQQREQQRQVQAKATKLEEQLLASRERIIMLEADIGNKAATIDQLNSDKQALARTIDQNNTLIKAKDEQIELVSNEKKAQEILLQRAKETQEIMEYVLGRFAPELAKKLQEILASKAQQQTTALVASNADTTQVVSSNTQPMINVEPIVEEPKNTVEPATDNTEAEKSS